MPTRERRRLSSQYAELDRLALKRPRAPVEPMGRVCFPHAIHPAMSELPPLPTTPPEISLLLRAHAEQHWLAREVLPVVRQVETYDGATAGAASNSDLDGGLVVERLPEEQLPAALAYLEVAWAEAVRRAGDTDGAFTRLDLTLPLPVASSVAAPCGELEGKARRYRAAVVALREGAARRVASMLAAPGAGLVASSS
jgi:hypothetical protein